MAQSSGRAARNAGPGGARVRRVKPEDWRNYLLRARETRRAMQRSADAAEWAAVIAIAPVCAISAVLALVARQANVVSRPDDYNTAAELLLIHGTGLSGLEQAARDFRHMLERKTTVQHGAEPATESIAREIMDYTNRFVDWVERQLAEPKDR